MYDNVVVITVVEENGANTQQGKDIENVPVPLLVAKRDRDVST